MQVAIFGAGLAGLAGAVALRTQGHQCRIYERSRQALDAGMGFILMPEALTALANLGVGARDGVLGMPLKRFLGRESNGDILDEQPLPASTFSIRRRDLICALTTALGDDSLISYDVELDHFIFDGGGEASAAVMKTGDAVCADLYVAADGCHSRTRAALYPSWPARPARVAEVVGMVRCRDAIAWAGENFNKFHALEGGLALGIVPVDPQHVVWFMQFDVRRYKLPGESPEARLKFVEQLVGTWADPVPHLIAHTDHSRVYLWRPIDTELVPHFFQHNVVLVGDAAHPMSPFTSRGVSSAVADVVTLSREIGNNAELSSALANYSAARRRDCAPYLAKGQQLTDKFLGPLSRDHTILPLAT